MTNLLMQENIRRDAKFRSTNIEGVNVYALYMPDTCFGMVTENSYRRDQYVRSGYSVIGVFKNGIEQINAN